MSTSSFLQSVRITDPKKAELLIDTLERAMNEPPRKIDYTVTEVRGEDVRKIFDNIKV